MAHSRAFVIGLNAGIIGRAARLLLGAAGVLTAGAWLVAHPAAWWVVALAFAAAAVFYAGVHRLVLWGPIAREPWLGTFIALAPLGLLGWDGIPEPVRTGVWAYVSAALALAGVMAYGGCEVVALPSLISGRRPTVYCPYNAIDAAERPLAQRARDLWWLAVGMLAVVVGAYFLIAASILSGLQLTEGAFRPAAVLLLLPAILLAWRAWRVWRAERQVTTEVSSPAVGAFALLALTMVFSGMVPQDGVWMALMLAGLIFAIVRLARRRFSPAFRHSAE